MNKQWIIHEEKFKLYFRLRLELFSHEYDSDPIIGERFGNQTTFQTKTSEPSITGKYTLVFNKKIN